MKKSVSLTMCVGLVVAIGCSQESPTTSAPRAANSAAAVDGSKYLLNSEPGDGMGVIQVREEAKDQDDVVIVGRIGGEINPWVDGRAAFLIVDSSLKSCTEVGSDGGLTPWDYC